MFVQEKKAVRSLFRTFLRLINDVEEAALQTSAQPFVATLLARRSKNSQIEKQFRTVQDVRNHIRDSFRQKSSQEELKERISLGIQGIRQIENVLHDLHSRDLSSKKQQSTTALESSSSTDDSWATSYVDQVKWLPSLEDENSYGTSHADQRTSHERVQLPLFPLTGPFFEPNLPLELFTSYSYWEFPTPGAEIMLKIFEPRYRELYNDLITQAGSNRRFVVPFAHPHQPATYAEYGLLYQITDWQEIADETNGVFQYVCQHVVTYPVRLYRVLNPRAYHTQHTYLRAEGNIEMNHAELDLSSRKQIEKALLEHAEESVATKCSHALLTEGVWGFIRSWNTSLQQQLLQIELQIAALVKMELNKYGKELASEKIKETVEKVQNNRRRELLQLKLDLAISIPLVLQTKSDQDRLKVILDFITARQKP